MNLVHDQVTRLNQLLADAKTRGEEICKSMHGDLENVVGSEWAGKASSTGQLSSSDLLAFWHSNLAPILDRLMNGITGTQNILTNQDDDDSSAISAAASGMNFGRL
ncbi:hypothetical protein CF166_12730 [Amycolatopsis sp. KNN50.9b]|nr:hypothetical protein CF166_12730 [Amycolatopsis sp. KNN50.9b]